MILDVPDVRQKGEHDCGEAAVECVLRFWMKGRQIPKFATFEDGADPRQLESALRLANLQVVSGEMLISDLRHFTKSGRPVICLTQEDSAGHYVVVKGVERRRVYYHDPLGREGWRLYHRWVETWHDRGRWGEAFVNFGLVAWPKT